MSRVRRGDTRNMKRLSIVDGSRGLLFNRSLVVVSSVGVHRLTRLRRVLRRVLRRLRSVRAGNVVRLVRVHRNSVVLRGGRLLMRAAASNAVEHKKDPTNELENATDDEAGECAVELSVMLGCAVKVIIIIVVIAGVAETI